MFLGIPGHGSSGGGCLQVVNNERRGPITIDGSLLNGIIQGARIFPLWFPLENPTTFYYRMPNSQRFCNITLIAKFYCECDVAKSLQIGPGAGAQDVT